MRWLVMVDMPEENKHPKARGRGNPVAGIYVEAATREGAKGQVRALLSEAALTVYSASPAKAMTS